MRWLALAVGGVGCLLALGPSCSRATLDLGAGGSGGGSGPSSTVGTGGHGGGGGMGGMPAPGWPCAIAVDGPIGVAAQTGFDQLQPRLGYSSDDRSEVTVAMQWRKSGGGPAPSDLRHASLSPWKQWPSGDVGPSFLASFNTGVSFAIASAPGNHFALAMSDGMPNGTGVELLAALTPGSGATMNPAPIDSGQDVLFASGHNNQHLVGIQPGPKTEPARIRVTTEVGNAIAIGSPFNLACGAVTATALQLGDGWLLAASGAPASFGANSCGPETAGLATSITIASAHGFGIPVQTATIMTGQVHRLVLAGAPAEPPWVVWLEDTAARAARLDAQGRITQGPGTLPDVAPDMTSLAAAPFMGGLLVAMQDSALNSAMLLFVASDGKVPAPMNLGALAGVDAISDALASPDGTAVLVASTSKQSDERIQLTRLRCAH